MAILYFFALWFQYSTQRILSQNDIINRFQQISKQVAGAGFGGPLLIWYDIVWYDIRKFYHMIWYDMTWYDMIWYNMIWYDIILENFIIWYHMISYDIIWYRYHMILSYDMILENFVRKENKQRTDRERTGRQFKTWGKSNPRG